MSIIDSLKWRYATKQYAPSKRVSENNMMIIKEAVQLAASSYGLQPYKVLDIQENSMRVRLKPASWNQSQITDASHLLVFCNYTEVTDQIIDDYMNLRHDLTGAEPSKLKAFGDFIKDKLSALSSNDIQNWTSRQVYIALSNAITACATLEIDCTPMEGFDPDKYNEILGLSAQGLNACTLLAVGYRHRDDANQHVQKVRKSVKDLFDIV